MRGAVKARYSGVRLFQIASIAGHAQAPTVAILLFRLTRLKDTGIGLLVRVDASHGLVPGRVRIRCRSKQIVAGVDDEGALYNLYEYLHGSVRRAEKVAIRRLSSAQVCLHYVFC